MELQLDRIFEGNKTTEEKQGEETAIQRYIAYQTDGGVKVTGSPFTEDILASNAAYVDQIKSLTAPGGRKFQRYEVGRLQSASYELELIVYFSKNGRYGGPVVRPPLTDEGRLEVAGSTELRAFSIPVPSVEKAIAPGNSEPVDIPSLIVRDDTTPITRITVEVPQPQFNVGIARVISQQVNQLHIIPDSAGNANLYRFVGARSVRQTGEGFNYRYEWEYDIGSPAREWGGDNPPRVFGDSGDGSTGTVSVASVDFTKPGGWWRPPYCQIGVDSIPFVNPLNPLAPATTVLFPIYLVDGLVDDPVSGFFSLPGLAGGA